MMTFRVRLKKARKPNQQRLRFDHQKLRDPDAARAASKILGKERHRKKPWVTKDVPDLFDERRALKKKRYEAEGAKEYREANRRIQKAVKKTKEDWVDAQCEEIETCLNKTNSKRSFQMVMDLASEKQGRSSTIQDMYGKCLTEAEILSRWDRILPRTVQQRELW